MKMIGFLLDLNDFKAHANIKINRQGGGRGGSMGKKETYVILETI